jgi:hypothetical protein
LKLQVFVEGGAGPGAAVLALPPFPIIQIEVLRFMCSKILEVIGAKSSLFSSIM